MLYPMTDEPLGAFQLSSTAWLWPFPVRGRLIVPLVELLWIASCPVEVPEVVGAN